MTKVRWILALMACIAIAIGATSLTQATGEQTVGVFVNEPGAQDGYTLFDPLRSTVTYLINNEGELVNSWSSAYTPGAVAYLRENGNLLRAANIRATNDTFGHIGGGGGRIEEYNWEGDLVWGFNYSVSTDQYLEEPVMQHHDVAELPNGNILILAWEFKSQAQAIQAGRDPAFLEDGIVFPEHIVEVEPVGDTGGNIVWEWHMWDHLVQDFDETKDNFGVVADHPELIDINSCDPIDDWIHANAINYNAELDQIIISARACNELWVIDHSTTTEEAAGHSGGNSGMGGDILYRWGNPQNYDRGDESDRQLFLQHDTQWIEPGLPGAGNILIYNNGQERTPEEYSTVDEIVPPLDGFTYTIEPGEPFGPEAPTWSYQAPNPTDFYSSFISGAQRQPNGNTLICEGSKGHLFEVTSEGDTVWSYVNPVVSTGPVGQGAVPEERANIVFRAYRYGADYPGLQGKELVKQGVIEGPKVTPGGPTDTPVTNTPSHETPEPPTATPVPPTPTATPMPVIVGDANGDGEVTSLDALLILQYDAGMLSMELDPAASDVNEDGEINSVDATLILQFDAGLIDELPLP